MLKKGGSDPNKYCNLSKEQDKKQTKKKIKYHVHQKQLHSLYGLTYMENRE